MNKSEGENIPVMIFTIKQHNKEGKIYKNNARHW